MLSLISKRFIKIGIRREGKNRWECRVPIVPAHVKKILQESPTSQIIVQPCTKRTFPNSVFEAAGAIIQEDLSSCDIILGVKEVPISELLPEKVYLFFSHTHKGQSHNMPLLQHIINNRITLLDYELLTDDSGKRTVKFGYFAGLVGAINGINGLGDRLLSHGYRTPFLNIGRAHSYVNLAHIKEALHHTSEQLSIYGIPQQLGPMIFCVTGTGNVSTGVMDILTLLPHEIITTKQLESISNISSTDSLSRYDTKKIYILQVPAADYLYNKDGKYIREEYHSNPSKYQSKFHEIIAPYITILFNGIYWNTQCPRLLTNSQLSKLASLLRLYTIADISVDLNGSIEPVQQITNIDDPFFIYEPTTGKIVANTSNEVQSKSKGIQIMAVDNLPTELARDASEYFSDSLFPYLMDYVRSNGDALTRPHFQRAMIVDKGQLVPRFEHLSKMISNTSTRDQGSTKKILLLGSGLVSRPFIQYFSSKLSFQPQLTVASNNAEELEALKTNFGKNIQFELLDLGSENSELFGLIQKNDIVVSLLPASMHVQVANACISSKKHMVTASYTTASMKELHEKAKEANIVIINEIGLDPGIDHLSAMKVIDSVKKSGGRIKTFVSWCGGLPAPEYSNNPFGYKFSWSPKGVLLALLNSAKYRKAGKLIDIDAGKLVKTVISVDMFPGFSFEGIANRDSIQYESVYGLNQIGSNGNSMMDTMFRGTLRYKGFSLLMDGFIQLGLLDTTPKQMQSMSTCGSWADAMKILLQSDTHSFEQAITTKLASSTMASDTQRPITLMPAHEYMSPASKVYRALQWLGAFSLYEPFDKKSSTILDAFCSLLQKKLGYGPGERDLVFLAHYFITENAQGNREYISSLLVCYGDQHINGNSAMAKTVGLPTAITAELILTDVIKDRGVIVPTQPNIYNPLLDKLKQHGINIIDHHSPFALDIFVP